ncbi:MAG: DUF308 domain-containing protein [Gordonia sp. (in: high G+C Gram-positive bacteria)]|uniref:HdeD family acid-resistance protein n=1 Tax=Gordonia sp. (in: high G+C Gram-positive bacteria) TaxID=84139 RepID=UPI0039E4625F
MSNNVLINPIPAQSRNAVRTAIIIASLIGIVFGLVAMFWSGPTVVVAAVLFGVALILMGLVRLYFAFASTGLSTGLRILSLVLGAALVVFGVIAVIHPGVGIGLLALWIGIGWILAGLQDLFGAREGVALAPRWLVILGGLISIAAGIIMCVWYPSIALETLVWVAGLLLVIFGVVSLFTLPAKAE